MKMLKTIKLDSDASKICIISLPWDYDGYIQFSKQYEMLELMATFQFIRTYKDDLIGNHKGKT